MALAFLSRMDMAFLSISVFTICAVRAISHAKNLRELLVNLRMPVAGGFFASMLVAPWLVWSYSNLGRLTPTSGAVLRWEIAQYPDRYGTYLESVEVAVHSAGLHVWYSFMYYRPESSITYRISLITALMTLAILVGIIYKSGLFKKTLKKLDFLFLTAILYYLYYFFYQTDMRHWYGLFTAYILTIIIGIAIYTVYRKITYSSRSQFMKSVVIGIFVIIVISASFNYAHISSQESAGTGSMDRIEYINENISTDSTLGSFNTGRYQYYTPQHEIINLDGLVNPESFDARREGSLDSHLCKNNIKYVLDPPRDVENLYQSGIELQEIKIWNHNSKYVLYKVTKIPNC